MKESREKEDIGEIQDSEGKLSEFKEDIEKSLKSRKNSCQSDIKNTPTIVPPLNIMALNQAKRVGTAANTLSNVYQGVVPKREGLETARTGRRMVNGGKFNVSL